MKKRLFGILLLLALSVCALSSCLLIDGGDLLDYSGGDDKGGDTVINVDGGDNYTINITPETQVHPAAAAKALLSSVSILTSSSAGSGVIYKLDKEKGNAYVITNYHVLHIDNTNNASATANVFLYGMEYGEFAIPATYVGGSMNYDIAILKIEASQILMESNAMAVSVGDSDKVAILDTAIAIGNPAGSGISATVGYVNVESEEIDVGFKTLRGTEYVSLRVMRTDAAVNSGNSGGGLFNDKGELIGIVNAKDADESVDNIGYAIPSNVAKAISDNIIYYCDNTEKTSVYRCMLGVEVGITAVSTEYNKETGLIRKIQTVGIKTVQASGAAHGYLKVNDVVNSVTVDGVRREVTQTYHLIDHMLYARVGSEVIINVTRGGEKMDIVIPITENSLKAY